MCSVLILGCCVATYPVLGFITIVIIGEEFKLNKNADVKMKIMRLLNEVQTYGLSVERRCALHFSTVVGLLLVFHLNRAQALIIHDGVVTTVMSFMTQHHVTSAVAYACLRKVGKIICY
jgi:hypothetical protein